MERRGMINVGFGNYVPVERILAVVRPDSAPTKRLTAEARDADRLIDATHGRRTRSIIITDSNHIVLSNVLSETLAQRFEASGTKEEEGQ
ncbi:MAG: DUF370 domain-containing protein [Deltaproteobacteria bacterium]|nr:DUF370 domain-containing protein [Deltaproteobacteria bacterium]